MVSIGNIMPNFDFSLTGSLSSIASLQNMMVLLYVCVIIIGFYLLKKIFFAPYEFRIYQKIGKNNVRWKGRDWGHAVSIGGNKMIKMFKRKIVISTPIPDVLIIKNKWTNIVHLLQLSEDEFVPITFDSESVQAFKPLDINLKLQTWNSYKMAEIEKQASDGILDKHKGLFNLMAWGVIGFLIIVISAKYSSSMIDSASKYSNNMMVDANKQAGSAAGQIASALMSIKVDGRSVPMPVPQPNNANTNSGGGG